MFGKQPPSSYVILFATLLFPEGDAAWVVNLPGSPMLLKGQIRGAYILRNNSGKKIVSFTLGCVGTKNRRPVVVSKLPKQEFSIVPGGSFGEAIVDAPLTDAYEQCVVREKAKLGLISVGFEDKTSWSFNESGIGNESNHR